MAALSHRSANPPTGKQFFCEQKNQKTLSCLPVTFEGRQQTE
jgi:hypothetical protein